MCDETSAEDQRIIDKVAGRIVDKGLAAPAIFLLESSKPLSFVASQGMLFLQPFVEAVLRTKDYEAFQQMLEKRENVERLLQKIEALEDERLAQRRAAKDKRKDDPGTVP
jgi:hypothetical protein